MLRAFVGAVAMLVAGPTLAAACPNSAAAEILTLTDWSLSISKDGLFDRATLTLAYESHAAKTIDHIEAYAVFEDRWGGFMSRIATRESPHLAPGASARETGSYFGTGLDRIPSLARADVVASICVDQVIYGDGTKEIF